MSNLDKKKVVVEEIKEKLEKSSSVVLCNGRGLSVGQDTKLRKDLREAGVEYKVYKNTLIHFAIQDTPFEGLDEYLVGPTTVAFSYDDPIIAARLIAKHQKDAKALEFKAGVVNEITYDEAGITKISQIPDMDVLYSKMLGSFKAPMGNFVRLMNAIKEELEEKNLDVAKDLVSADSKEAAVEAEAVEEKLEELVEAVEEAEVIEEAPEAEGEENTEEKDQ